MKDQRVWILECLSLPLLLASGSSRGGNGRGHWLGKSDKWGEVAGAAASFCC